MDSGKFTTDQLTVLHPLKSPAGIQKNALYFNGYMVFQPVSYTHLQELSDYMRQNFGSEKCGAITCRDEGEAAAQAFKDADGRNNVCAPIVMACVDYTIDQLTALRAKQA